MALDLGGPVDVVDAPSHGDVAPPPAPAMPTLNDGPDVGAALKAVREFQGLTLEDVAETTRIRPAYLTALEELRVEDLPSRPFTIGYIRAYAGALGLDADAAVNRFKTDGPEADDVLRNPIGVRREKDPRLGVVIAGGLLILAAIVAWNVAQRAITAQNKPEPAQTAEVAQPDPAAAANAAGPSQVSLGAPLPAPVESTTPTPYVTPGLADAVAAGGSADAVAAAAKVRAAEQAAAVKAPPVNLGAPFKADGQVYGASMGASPVVLQARKGAGIVVRGADNSVYFARQLAVGEAYRVPAIAGLQIDVSDPSVVEVYVNGALTGHLPSTLTPLSKLGAPAAPAPKVGG